MRNRHFYNQTPLYENIYSKLMQLLPDLQLGVDIVAINHSGGMLSRFEVLERHRYTTMVKLVSNLGCANSAFSNLLLKITIYHDVRVAEVIGYQNHYKFQPDYNYPNKQMYLKDEKHQVNRLLSELLDLYLKRCSKSYIKPLGTYRAEG